MILVTNSEGTPGVATTASRLASGDGVLDAIESGIQKVEADPSIRTVGRGGWANLLGEVELDAAIMCGDSLRTGAIGAVKGYLHPISIARRVLNDLPHELLVGAGAERFASEIGAETADNLIEGSARVWQAWKRRTLTAEEQAAWPDIALAKHCQHAIDPEKGRDTTVFLGMDRQKTIASGVSTSGWAWKYPGRLGDSPIIGAGSYADSRYGAAACTGAGEMAIRSGTARSIVLYMKMGMTVEAAVDEAVADIRCQSGGLQSRITLHAIDAKGGHRVVALGSDEPLFYWFWQEGDPEPQKRPAAPVAL